MITSAHNPKIIRIRDLQAHSQARREAGAFVVEGVRLVEEALTAGWPAEWVLYTEEIGERGRRVVEGYQIQGAPVEAVTPQVMKAASDTRSPQGILAVLTLGGLPLPAQVDFVFIPDGVRDPGNLGSMLRTAAGAGVQGVVLPPGTADAFAPKVLRAGMGAHFRMPVYALSWEGIAAYLDQARLRVYLADAQGGQPYHRTDWQIPLALIIGGEAEGAGAQAQHLAHTRVHIPMPGRVESLNAAAAAAILLFEAARQRSPARQ